MVPAQAIIPEARDRKVILNKNGTAVFATVVTGYRDSSRVEILSGLQIGDTVVTSGLMAIRPGSKIIVNVVE
jgi:membrane fusion protein (multidrug efflux system)